jgi:hypothetical protein
MAGSNCFGINREYMTQSLMQLPIPDTEVMWRTELPPASADAIALGKYWHVRKGELDIDLPGVARYRITGGKRIEIALMPGADRGSAEFFLMSTPFAALIHQRGEFALHASAVLSPLSGKALLISGVSGAGKSTTAAALAKRGWIVINDDVSRITLQRNEPMVWPGFANLKLWRQSCQLLNLDNTTLARTRGGKEKYLWPGKTAIGAEGAPIGAMLELVQPTEPPGAPERIAGREVLEAYFSNTFRPRLVAGLGCNLTHFQHASRLAATVPTYRFQGSRQLSPEVLADELEKLPLEAPRR